MKYEYKLLSIPADKWTSSGFPEDLNIQFDELGKQGWLLTEMKPVQGSGFMLFGIGWPTYTSRFIAVFRRELE